MNPEVLAVLQNVKEYCEDMAIYDKLSQYGDFYYKIVRLLQKETESPNAMLDELNASRVAYPNEYIREQVRLLHKDGIPVVIPGCPLPKKGWRDDGSKA